MGIFRKNNKKSGFTLMEIALAVLIVAILAMLTVPMVQRQLSKSDEYAYYTAYKTIEKLGGQVVARGDSFENPDITLENFQKLEKVNKFKIAFNKFNQKARLFIALTTNKLVYSEAFLFNHLFPNTFAASSETAFEDENYNALAMYLQYCSGKQVYDMTGAQDYIYQECDGAGYNCQNKKKCDSKNSNCCNTAYVNIDDTPSCNASWKFQQRYNKTTKIKTKTICEKKEDGTKVDPKCEEKVVETSNTEEGLTSCSPSSTGNTTVTCTKANSEKVQRVGHLVSRADAKKAIEETLAEGGNITNCNPEEGKYLSQAEKVAIVKGLLAASTCSPEVVSNNYETGESVNSDYDTASMISYLENGYSGSSFCSTFVKRYCTTTDDMGNTYSVSYSGGCNINKSTPTSDNTSFTPSTWTRPTPTNICTSSYGYYNMHNTGGQYSVICECLSGYLVSENNDKVCCQQPADSDKKSYATSSGTCIDCTTDFNSVTNRCCPKYSTFNGTSCECANGYEMQNPGTTGEYCKQTTCFGASHMEDGVCVTNPPILSAQNLCRSIQKYWNTTSASCNSFTGDYGVNQSVYNAAMGNDGKTFMSIAAKGGSFGNVTPNIVLSNGMKLWILSNKAGSIPGLSYNPTNISETQNVCKDLKKTTKAACSLAGGTFCKAESNCFTMDNESLKKMGDARNCCASPDMISLAENANFEKDNRSFAINGFTIFVDINGDKGSSTLWEDVFPFFASANGQVYPGYPLDGYKANDEKGKNSGLYLAANSSTYLPVDVYYYASNSSGKSRRKIVAYSGVSYARGACYAKMINKYTPYCMNLGDKFVDGKKYSSSEDSAKLPSRISDADNNPCNDHKCFVGVRKKLRFF